MKELYPAWPMPHPAPLATNVSTFPTDSKWWRRTADALLEIETDFARSLLDELDQKAVAGEIVEFGVAFGGWLFHLANHREANGSNRSVWGFDSFEGLPKTTEHDLDCWAEGQYAADYGDVSARLQASLRPWLHLVKGWFSDTLPTAQVQSIEKIAFARIDCDLYRPAVECLDFLTSRISVGSIIVFDDWTYNPEKGETKALLEWLDRNPSIQIEFITVIGHGHFYFRVAAV